MLLSDMQSLQQKRELPGLKGFSARNLRYMRTFYEEWRVLDANSTYVIEGKPSYLGQLQGYLSVLDGFEKKPHENLAIGVILCRDMNKSFVDYVIQDYSKPMGVATYKTSKDMSEELKKALPDIEELKRLLDTEAE